MKFFKISLLLLIFMQKAVADEYSLAFYIDNNLLNQFRTENFYRGEMTRWVNELNDYYINSDVDLTVKIGYIEFGDFTNSGVVTDPNVLLADMTKSRNSFSNLDQNADKFGADYSVSVVTFLKDACGQAADVNGSLSASSLQTVVRFHCDSDTLAHEIGHLMGLAHGEQVATCYGSNHRNGSVTSYAKGHAVSNCDGDLTSNEFGTLMVQNYMFGSEMENSTANNIPMFSNANISTCRGGACGNTSTGDASRALNLYKSKYAGYETIDADHLDYSGGEFEKCITDVVPNKEISEVTVINCLGKNIKDINGIEQLTSLRIVHLEENNINVVSPLEKLDKNIVYGIQLRGNDTAICSQLDSLELKFPGKVQRPSKCFNLAALIAVQSLLL